MAMKSGDVAQPSRPLSPLRSIRLKCLDCCAGNAKEVRECRVGRCALHPFRLGTNPNRAGIGGFR